MEGQKSQLRGFFISLLELGINGAGPYISGALTLITLPRVAQDYRSARSDADRANILINSAVRVWSLTEPASGALLQLAVLGMQFQTGLIQQSMVRDALRHAETMAAIYAGISDLRRRRAAAEVMHFLSLIQRFSHYASLRERIREQNRTVCSDPERMNAQQAWHCAMNSFRYIDYTQLMQGAALAVLRFQGEFIDPERLLRHVARGLDFSQLRTSVARHREHIQSLRAAADQAYREFVRQAVEQDVLAESPETERLRRRTACMNAVGRQYTGIMGAYGRILRQQFEFPEDRERAMDAIRMSLERLRAIEPTVCPDGLLGSTQVMRDFLDARFPSR